MKPQVEIAIPSISTTKFIQLIKKDLLGNIYSNNPANEREKALNKKIEDVYEEEFDKPFFSNKVAPSHAAGAPGVGKTTSYMVAGEWVANKLGFNYVENPIGNFEATEDDFVVTTLELSGETSKTIISGVPVVVQMDNGEKVTMSAPPRAFENLKKAGYGMLLLDDMPNALAGIQNMCLSLMERKGFQTISIGEKTFVGSTGNLGKLDGTNVSSTSSANATRRQNYLLYDTAEDWVGRANLPVGPQHQRGDAYLGDFFKQNPDLFTTISTSKNSEPFATPRTWSKFLEYARTEFAQYNKMLERSNSKSDVRFDMQEIMFRAESIVGIEAAGKLKGFYLSITNSVMPIAKRLIDGSQLSDVDTQLIAAHAGKVGNESELFFSQLNRILGEFTATKISNEVATSPNDWIEKSNAVIGNYTNALVEYILKLNKVDKIGSSFVALSNKLCTIHNNPSVGEFSKVTHTPRLNKELAIALVKSFAEHPATHQKMGEKPLWKICAADVLSNIANYETTSNKVDSIQNQLAGMDLESLMKHKPDVLQEPVKVANAKPLKLEPAKELDVASALAPAPLTMF
jgi:hypothetical protein